MINQFSNPLRINFLNHFQEIEELHSIFFQTNRSVFSELNKNFYLSLNKKTLCLDAISPVVMQLINNSLLFMTEKEMPFHQFVVSSEKAKKKTIQICRNKQKQVGNANRLKPKRFFHLVLFLSFFFFFFFFDLQQDCV
jgi:hypothetical protein